MPNIPKFYDSAAEHALIRSIRLIAFLPTGQAHPGEVIYRILFLHEVFYLQKKKGVGWEGETAAL